MVELGKTIEASQSYQNSVELGTARCSHRSLAELIGSGHNWAVFLVVGRAWRSSTERNFWKLKAPKGVQWSLWSSNELAGNFELVRARQRLRRSLDLRRALLSPMQLGRFQLSSSALGGACRSFLELGKNRWSLRSPVKLDRAIRLGEVIGTRWRSVGERRSLVTICRERLSSAERGGDRRCSTENKT